MVLSCVARIIRGGAIGICEGARRADCRAHQVWRRRAGRARRNRFGIVSVRGNGLRQAGWSGVGGATGGVVLVDVALPSSKRRR